MTATIIIKERAAINSGLWPEHSFTGEMMKITNENVLICHPDYFDMTFPMGDVDRIEFHPTYKPAKLQTTN